MVYQVHSCRVERERGEVLRAGGFFGLSRVLRVAQVWKLYRNPFLIDKVFHALVQSSVEFPPEFCEF
jgi:hypothetical protein